MLRFDRRRDRNRSRSRDRDSKRRSRSRDRGRRDRFVVARFDGWNRFAYRISKGITTEEVREEADLDRKILVSTFEFYHHLLVSREFGS